MSLSLYTSEFRVYAIHVTFLSTNGRRLSRANEGKLAPGSP
jgi:hypothetical protein